MSATTTTTGNDSQAFVHRGRTYTVFRREPQGKFYIRRQINKKATWKSLDTTIPRIAIQNAKLWIDALDRVAIDDKWGQLDPLRSRSTPFASIEQVTARYTERGEQAAQISHRTVISNISSLRSLLQLATGSSYNPDTRTDVLTENLVRTYVERARAAGRSDTGIRSTLIQARSIFSKSLIYIYEGFRLPDLTGFRIPIRFQTTDDVGFEPIPQDTVQRMERAAAAMRDIDPVIWLTYMLMSRLGMRNVEIERAERDWLHTDSTGASWLHLPKCKNGNPRHIQLPPDLTREMIEEITGSSQHLIPAKNPTERHNIVNRHINRFVNQFLSDRNKKAYELRKLAGSIVWSTQGAEAAQYFLGHTSIQTTQQYYAKFLRPVRAVTPDDRSDITASNKIHFNTSK